MDDRRTANSSLENTRAWLQERIKSDSKITTFVITSKDKESMKVENKRGLMGIIEIIDANDGQELSLILNPRFWRGGVGREAGSAIINAILEAHPASNIYAHVVVVNNAMKHILETWGFKAEKASIKEVQGKPTQVVKYVLPPFGFVYGHKSHL